MLRWPNKTSFGVKIHVVTTYLLLITMSIYGYTNDYYVSLLYFTFACVFAVILSTAIQRKYCQLKLLDTLVTLIPLCVVSIFIPVQVENIFELCLRAICLISYYALWQLALTSLMKFIFDDLETK